MKNEENVFVLKISTFELVAVNSPDSSEKTCNRQSLY